MSEEYMVPAFYNEKVFDYGCKAVAENNWKDIRTMFFFDAPTGAALLDTFQDDLPLEFCCEVALHHYIGRGDQYTVIRNLVKQAKCIRPENWRDALPEAVRNNEVFTVYRASGESLDEVKGGLAWTIFREVAEWFVERNTHRNLVEQHLYCGELNAEDVIAYLNDRCEFEVLSDGKVRNIVELTPVGTSPEFMKLHELGLHYDTVSQAAAGTVALFNRRMMAAAAEENVQEKSA